MTGLAGQPTVKHEKMSLMYIRNKSAQNPEEHHILLEAVEIYRNQFEHIESERGDTYASSLKVCLEYHNIEV